MKESLPGLAAIWALTLRSLLEAEQKLFQSWRHQTSEIWRCRSAAKSVTKLPTTSYTWFLWCRHQQGLFNQAKNWSVLKWVKLLMTRGSVLWHAAYSGAYKNAFFSIILSLKQISIKKWLTYPLQISFIPLDFFGMTCAENLINLEGRSSLQCAPK